MKNKFSNIVLVAGIMLALALTFSCSSNSDDETISCSGEGGSLSYKGKTYRTVIIGEQTWMAENLNYDVSGSECYNNLEANCNIFGRLYDWATAMALPSDCNSHFCSSQIAVKHQGICPSGWHIPSNSEWQKLVDYVGGDKVAGKRLKATSGWNSCSNGLRDCKCEDTCRFSALPGGDYYFDYGMFIERFVSFGVGEYGWWWRSNESDGLDGCEDGHCAHVTSMSYNSESVNSGGITNAKRIFNSVRCVQD